LRPLSFSSGDEFSLLFRADLEFLERCGKRTIKEVESIEDSYAVSALIFCFYSYPFLIRPFNSLALPQSQFVVRE
jgi:hypothetical protein